MAEGSPFATADRQERETLPKDLPTLEKAVAEADEGEKEALPSNGNPTEETVGTIPTEDIEGDNIIVE